MIKKNIYCIIIKNSNYGQYLLNSSVYNIFGWFNPTNRCYYIVIIFGFKIIKIIFSLLSLSLAKNDSFFFSF